MVAGRPLDSAYTEENLPLLRAGMANLKAHLDIAAGFECRSWSINRFPADSEHELELVRSRRWRLSVAVITEHHARGGEGASWGGQQSSRASSQPSQFEFLYPLDRPIKETDRDHRHQDLSAGRSSTHSRRRPRSPTSNGRGSAIHRSAWPRPTYRSATTLH